MSVKTKKGKKQELEAYTAIVMAKDTMEKYVAYIQVLDVTDGHEVTDAIIAWLESNTFEPEGWTKDCFSIVAMFEGVRTAIDLSPMGLSLLIEKWTKNLSIIRELALGDDIYLVMCKDSNNAVDCLRFFQTGGDWEVSRDVTGGDYVDGMDWLVANAADHDHEYTYKKTMADPF